MSLINCPECNKEISDKAHNCPYCGYPISDLKVDKTNILCNINGKLYNLDNALQLSLEGKYKESFIRISETTKLSIKNCLNILERIKILDEIPESYNIKEYSKEEEKQAGVVIFSMKDDIIKHSNSKSNTQVTCPKCGSTQIQIVPRKFSLLTGFLTNKTDRVCVNCKYKW